MFHRNSFIFLCLILFLSISTPVFAAEEPDLSGGVITSIPRQRFLENINPIHFSTADDPKDLLSYLQEQYPEYKLPDSNRIKGRSDL